MLSAIANGNLSGSRPPAFSGTIPGSAWFGFFGVDPSSPDRSPPAPTLQTPEADPFSVAKVAGKCDRSLVRTAAALGEDCGYVHSQALLGAAEKEPTSQIPGSPMAVLSRGGVGGRITLVECSRRGQPSFTRVALAGNRRLRVSGRVQPRGVGGGCRRSR